MNFIRYEDKTRVQFDQSDCSVLDALKECFPVVEVAAPEIGASRQPMWLVQVWKSVDDDLPTGMYGDTLYEAASALAQVLKVPYGSTDTIELPIRRAKPTGLITELKCKPPTWRDH